MDITLSERLKSYMASKQRDSLLVSTYQAHGWTGLPEQVVRLVDTLEADELREKGVASFPADTGEVFITKQWIPEHDDARIEFDLEGFLMTKTIVAKGLRRPELFF